MNLIEKGYIVFHKIEFLLGFTGLFFTAMVMGPQKSNAATLTVSDLPQFVSVTFFCEDQSCQFKDNLDPYYFEDFPGYRPAYGVIVAQAQEISMEIEVTYNNPDPNYYIQGAFSAHASAEAHLTGVSGQSGRGISVGAGPLDHDAYYHARYDREDCAGYGTVTCGIIAHNTDYPYVGPVVEFTENDIVGPLSIMGSIYTAIDLEGLSGRTTALATVEIGAVFIVDGDLGYEPIPDDPQVIPVPASLPLLTGALAVLAGAARRRRLPDFDRFGGMR